MNVNAMLNLVQSSIRNGTECPNRTVSSEDETQTRVHKTCDAKTVDAGMRYTQRFELLIERRDYEGSPYFAIPKIVSSGLFAVHVFDTAIHTVEDAEAWIQAALDENSVADVAVVIDGKKYELMSCMFWECPATENLRGISFDGFPACCKNCGRVFFNAAKRFFNQPTSEWVFDGYDRTNRVFCSDDCRVKHNRQQQTERRRIAKRSAETSIVCQMCEVTFTCKKTGSRFCSTKCRVASHRKTKKPASKRGNE